MKKNEEFLGKIGFLFKQIPRGGLFFKGFRGLEIFVLRRSLCKLTLEGFLYWRNRKEVTNQKISLQEGYTCPGCTDSASGPGIFALACSGGEGVEFVDTKNQLADIFTKHLPKETFFSIRRELGLLDISDLDK